MVLSNNPRSVYGGDDGDVMVCEWVRYRRLLLLEDGGFDVMMMIMVVPGEKKK